MTQSYMLHDPSVAALAIGRPQGTGERRLMAAILEDVVACIMMAPREGLSTKAAQRTQTVCSEARAWVASDDAGYTFTFVNVCYGLGLDPTAVRRSLHVAPARAA